MSTRKSTVFYAVMLTVASIAVGMVIASRLDLTPRSFASDLNVPPTNSAPLSGPIDAATFRNIAKEASPSVVLIEVTMTRQVNDMSDLFNFMPFGNGRGTQQPRDETVAAAGSGFIIDKAGYIITNNHVIDNAKAIRVFLSDADSDDFDDGYPAKVIGHDELSDTALIQLERLPDQPLEAAKFGDSSQLAPGDWVMAIGSPFKLSNSVTVGVVSYNGRGLAVSNGRQQDFIQTDAAINHGNSGGPLLNLRGEVVGVNTAIVSGSDSGGNVGVGFAIPINTVRDLLPQLRQGKVTRGRIGVFMSSRRLSADDAKDLGLPNTNGVLVAQVPDGPAKDAGIQVQDVITEFNGKPVTTSDALADMVARTAPGTTVPVKIIRDKKPMTLNIKVAELDLQAEQDAGQAGGNGASESDAFGMSLRDITPNIRQRLDLPVGRTGAVVTDVAPFGPAANAGIEPGDVVLSVQNTDVRNAADAKRALDAIPSGRLARIVVWSQGAEVLRQVRKR
ncbi:MAG TPA: trypsin-like peptidase domain-containing protein [Vicinamibacterales bacterium]|jgi:serine protease Do|nr:trypsin-like peptidase domain-containing protein [Vicinamibacterales bacterium]